MTGSQLRRGDLVLTVFPYSDLSRYKLRPTLVVGLAGNGDVILAFITSRPLPATNAICRIDLFDDEFESTGLKVSSTIRLDKLATLDHRLGPKTSWQAWTQDNATG